MVEANKQLSEIHNIEIWLREGGDDDLIKFYHRLEQVSRARAKKAFITLLEAVRTSGRLHLNAFSDPNAEAEGEAGEATYRKIRLHVDASQYRNLVRLWHEIPRRSRSMHFIAMLRSGIWRYDATFDNALLPLAAMVPGLEPNVVPEPAGPDYAQSGGEGGLPNAPWNDGPDEDPGWPGEADTGNEAESPLGEPGVAVAIDDDDESATPASAENKARVDDEDEEEDFAPYDDPLESLLRSANDDALFDSET